MGATPDVAAEAARAAQPLWALLPAAARARYVRRAAVAMLDELDELAGGLADETGWPRAHLVVAELLPAVRGLHALAGEGPAALVDRRLHPRTARLARRRSVLIQAPAGIVGLAGPSASPWFGPAVEVGAALLAGNGVLLAAGPPLAAQRLRAVFLRAGIPGELIAPVADVGSVCDRVTELSPPTRMGTLLVLRGASRTAVVDAAVWAAFAGSGRHPAAAGRLVVSRVAAPGLGEAIADAAARLRVGDPRDPTTDVGPLASEKALAAVEAALAAGGEVRGGGRVRVPRSDGAFYAPAVVMGGAAGHRPAAFDEPPPGPVLAIVETAGDDEAIALAGSGGREGVVSVWTGDRERGERVARALPAAVVWVGRHGVPAPTVAVRLARHVAPRRLESRARRTPAAMRLPTRPDAVEAQAALAEARHGRESRRWPALRRGAAALARAARRQG